jgi:D-3-phosphoglycerate dehydrogenase
MTPSSNNRILVANRNVPNMVGQITTLLAESRINIVDMLNRSRNEVAHNIIDCENGVPEELLEKIFNIEGVIMTRLIRLK